MMALLAKKIKLERDIETAIAELEERNGEIPEEYMEEIMHFYELREVWDTYLSELMEEWKEELEE